MNELVQRRSGVALSSLILHPVSLAVALSICGTANAQGLDAVVVSATRTAQRLADTLADVTVLDSEVIARSNQDSLAELLSRQPGMQMTTTGGPGTTTSVFIRGAATQYTAVYLDGVRLESQTTSGGVTWQSIPLALIERIEILRGPAAAVYGSDAIGGVVLLFTKRGEGRMTPTAGVGYGSHGNFRANAGLSGASGAWDYSLAAVREGSQGVNSKTVASADPDSDGYRRTALNASLGLRINAAHRLQAQLMRAESVSDYDNASRRDGAQYQRQMQAIGLTWQAQWTERWSSSLAANRSDDDYTLQPSQEQTKTRLNTYLWQNVLALGQGQQLTAALERREDRFRNPKIDQGGRSRQQNALALGWGLQRGAHTLQLNARHDKDSEFGGKSTGSAAYGWNFAPQWRLHASAGTAFRVPTLYQRYSIYGDADLRAETSRNTELGLRWAEGDRQFSATAYRNHLNNMVSFAAGGRCGQSSCYRNVDQAVLEGLTLAGALRTGALKWQGSMDWQNPRDEKTGQLLARRSQRYLNLGVETNWQAWELGAEMQLASRRHDKEGDAKILGGYSLFNLTAARELSKDIRFKARIDNLLDRNYTLAKDYATNGRTLYVGLQWTPR